MLFLVILMLVGEACLKCILKEAWDAYKQCFSHAILQQEDIRSYIDHSIKRGAHLSVFRKERVGGDSYGISYWYFFDLVILKWKINLFSRCFSLFK